MSDIYLFGHSFVNHLRKYVLKDGSRHNLGWDPIEFKVHFHGHEGLSLLQQQRLRSVGLGVPLGYFPKLVQMIWRTKSAILCCWLGTFVRMRVPESWF